jgi:putative hydrolase of the HAD superfamily
LAADIGKLRMIEAVLWDFGGVITTSPFERFARYEAERGLPTGIIRHINATNSNTNAWARFERSEIGAEEFCALFSEEARYMGREIPGADVLALIGGELRPEMVTALRRCKEKLKIGCITNNMRQGSEKLLDAAAEKRRAAVKEVMALFDMVIYSSEAGIRKPDPRIYRMACEALGVAPAYCVFLDDIGINLKPAREMGITTIKVVDPKTALDELEKIIGFSVR